VVEEMRCKRILGGPVKRGHGRRLAVQNDLATPR
jgi:hypothetical protein